LTPERIERLTSVAARRQPDFTIILENVHDPHNIGAVLRSCDSVGIKEIFVLYTEGHLGEDRIEMGTKTSSGALKWVDVQLYRDPVACFNHVKSKYETIWATHLGESASSLYELDLTASVALLFGNEHDGLSEQALSYADGNFVIPQMGMVQSLNISVACAVSVYEALRQRNAIGRYTDHKPMNTEQQKILAANYLERSDKKNKNRFIKVKQ
jgi:tRNA (guanosine-2'-O-)-methyltransferase